MKTAQRDGCNETIDPGMLPIEMLAQEKELLEGPRMEACAEEIAGGGLVVG